MLAVRVELQRVIVPMLVGELHSRLKPSGKP